MTVSKLQRMLLYRGHDDMADYLRNSPFNRCVYNVILRHGPKPLPMNMLTLFNEVYYQCVRINYDPTPGTDLHNRYVQEETLWLSSVQSANLIFNIVWFVACQTEEEQPKLLWALLDGTIGIERDELMREANLQWED